MEYISIIPSDLDLSSEHRYLRLPHPRTGQPQLYLPHGPSILEVSKINCSKRRTWFIGDSKIDAGSILFHHPIDPMFLVIPIILSLLSPNGSSAPTPFQPLSDLVAAASSSSMFSIPSPFSSNSSTDGGWNEDISRLLALKPVRRVFKLCCERKVIPGAPPSPPPDVGSSITSEKEKRQVYYRPYLDLTLRLLRLKIEYFASESQFGKFDHLIRSLGRDGLLEPGANGELVKLARTKASIEHMAQWLPSSIVISLTESSDLSKLSEHLANLSASAIAASLPIVQGTKNQEEGAKRKPPPASRGVEALKKVNTSSMSKMTSFFKPKT